MQREDGILSTLRATITKREKCNKSSKITLPSSKRKILSVFNSSPNNNNISSTSDTSSDEYEDTITQQSSLNFSTGISTKYLTILIKSEQLIEAKERTKLERAKREDLVTCLRAAICATTGFVWKEGTNCLANHFLKCAKKRSGKGKDVE